MVSALREFDEGRVEGLYAVVLNVAAFSVGDYLPFDAEREFFKLRLLVSDAGFEVGQLALEDGVWLGV